MARAPAATGARRFKKPSTVHLMLIASIVLSVASFYTTYLGMKQYVAPEDWWLAAAITFGLQATMFATAWIASETMTTSLKAFFVYLGIYLLCAVVSIFFSFSSLFNSIFDERQKDLVNANFMRAFYQEVTLELETKLEEETTALHTQIVTGANFAEWRRKVDNVVALLRSAPEILSRRVETSRAENETALSEVRGLVAAQSAELDRLKSEQERLRAQLEALDQRLGLAQEQLTQDRELQADLRSQIAVLEARMEAELQGIGSNAGIGPIYNGLKEERDILLRELIPVETRITTAANNPDVQERDRLSTKLQELASSVARIDSEVDAATRQKTDLEKLLAESSTVRTLDGLESIQLIDVAIREAATSPDALANAVDEAISICGTVLSELMSDPQLSAQTSSLSCDADALQIEIAELRSEMSIKLAFEALCRDTGLPDFPDGQAFTMLADATEACITASGIPDNELRSRLSLLEATRGPDAHPFVVAQNALFVDRLPVSYMAAVIAIVIDLLILLVALMAQMVKSGRVEKAIEAMTDVKYADRNGGKVAYVEVTPGTYNYEARRTVARDLVARDLALFDEQKEHILYITAAGRHYLLRKLEMQDF